LHHDAGVRAPSHPHPQRRVADIINLETPGRSFDARLAEGNVRLEIADDCA